MSFHHILWLKRRDERARDEYGIECQTKKEEVEREKNKEGKSETKRDREIDKRIDSCVCVWLSI